MEFTLDFARLTPALAACSHRRRLLGDMQVLGFSTAQAVQEGPGRDDADHGCYADRARTLAALRAQRCASKASSDACLSVSAGAARGADDFAGLSGLRSERMCGNDNGQLPVVSPRWSNADLHVVTESSQEVHQPFHGEVPGPIAHQQRHLRLPDAKDFTSLRLCDTTRLDDAVELLRQDEP